MDAEESLVNKPFLYRFLPCGLIEAQKPNMVRCNLCNQELGRITETHLWHKHKMHFPKFISQFPEANIGLLPWNKGRTKETDPSLAKLSYNLRLQKEWNFSK